MYIRAEDCAHAGYIVNSTRCVRVQCHMQIHASTIYMYLHVHMFSCFYRQEEEVRFQKQKLENSRAELHAEKERSAD